MAVTDEQEVAEIVARVLADPDPGFRNLISILQRIQAECGYLPETALVLVAQGLALSPANVMGVAGFYNQFKFTPPGKCHIRVCMGTACHIRQGGLILDQWKRKLEIEEGGRTADGEYSLERVACVGACAQAPISIVGGEVIGKMAPTKVDGILLSHRIEREREARARVNGESDGREGET